MTRQQARHRQLVKVSSMMETLTERMMTAYVVGSHPSEAEVRAFCQGVVLLEEQAVPLPPFAEDVIRRLQAQDEGAEAVRPVVKPVPRAVPGPLMIARRAVFALFPSACFRKAQEA